MDANKAFNHYRQHLSRMVKRSTRDADGNTINPDVVIIYRGCNDMTHKTDVPSTYARLTDFGAHFGADMSIPDTDVIEGGLWGFKEAYALTIKKIRAKYPNALIICCTLNIFLRANSQTFPVNNGINTLPEFNNAIREVADMMGCPVIELDKDGLTFDNYYPTYTANAADTTHPNPLGHRMMALKAIADVQKM